MKVTLNGEEINLNYDMTINQLVDSYKLDVKKIAVERNLEIVSQSEFKSTNIEDGDNIEIIHFIGGG